MFTGIVESVGKIGNLKAAWRGLHLTVECPKDLKLRKGDSLAVDGVCLTCEKVDGKVIGFTLSPETLSRTRFGALKKGQHVNLERPLQASGRLGGHFVQGHADGMGTVAALEKDPPGWMLLIDLPDELARLCVEKGSIAVNGVSLTVARILRQRVWIALIPYTWNHTSLRDLKPGDGVNVECDILAKYVERLMHPVQDRSTSETFLWRFVKEGSTE
ncbi:MAG TPA: riboflavin synthase [Acidobacteriota bacterium]|jgi:riboflavin synthase